MKSIFKFAVSVAACAAASVAVDYAFGKLEKKDECIETPVVEAEVVSE